MADSSTPADTFVAPTLAKDQSTGVDFAKEMKPEETHNVAKAQKLWNEGLKEEGRKKADLTYYMDDQTINKNVAQFVQSQVETKLKNAKVEIHAVPAKNVQDNVMRGNFDMYLSLWLADYTDLMSDMDVYNQIIIKIMIDMKKQLRVKVPKKLITIGKICVTLQNQLTKDTAVVPLYNMTESHLARKNLRRVLWHSVSEADYIDPILLCIIIII